MSSKTYLLTGREIQKIQRFRRKERERHCFIQILLMCIFRVHSNTWYHAAKQTFFRENLNTVALWWHFAREFFARLFFVGNVRFYPQRYDLFLGFREENTK